MRKSFSLTLLCVLGISYLHAQTNIFPSTGAAGIGTITPNASSLLDITSTTNGILIPRMTKNQRDLIASPATGLMIFQTNSTPGFYYYSGSAWTAISTKGANSKLSNLVAPTAVNQSLLPGVNNTLNVGSALLGWKDIYFTGNIYSGGIRFINTDASNTWVGLYAGQSNTGTYNNAFGYSALASNTSGSSNNAFGYGTLSANSTGSNNVALGQSVMHSNTSGLGNTATGFGGLYLNVTGSYNNAYGHFALFNNTTGYSNVAIGNAALFSNTTAHNLVAVGDSALYNQSTREDGQYYNTAIGSKALFSNTTGNYNNANGYWGLYYNTTGAFNTANGSYVLIKNTTGSFNTANGYAALFDNTTGSSNTANGSQSLANNINGNYNTANGIYSLSENTAGNTNTANGAFALGQNITGNSNVAIGVSALLLNTAKSNLVAVGDSALYKNGTGATIVGQSVKNTAVGSKSLYANTTGTGNTANGFQTLYYNTTGGDNSAHGSYALYGNSTGAGNTANGTNSLSANTTGSNNTADGGAALDANTTGGGNTAIGSFADVITGNLTNATAIGSNAVVDASNKVRVGDVNVTSIGGKVGWTTFPSDRRYKKNINEDVKGLAFINILKPITYTVDMDALNTYFDKNKKHDDAYEKMKKDMQPAAEEASKIVYNGFIAQDVETAAKKLNYNFSGVDKPQTKDGLYGLRYGDFVVPLVKAVQELSLQNDSLKNENAVLRKDFNDLKDLVLSIRQKQEQCSPCNAVNTISQSQSYTTLSDASSLEQNIPNPFTNTTSIGYTLPIKFTNAQIVITDKSGKTIKAINISGSSKGNLNIDAATLASGAYQYSLYVNAKLIDTKQMILVK